MRLRLQRAGNLPRSWRMAAMKNPRGKPGGDAKLRMRSAMRQSAQHAVFLEPRSQLFPAVLGRGLVVARPVIGVEAVRRAWIDVEFGGLAERLHLRFHF